MGMSEFYGPASEAESVRTIHRALELGVTFLDTADMYGANDSERFIGEALEGRRERVVIATKFGFHDGGSPATVHDSIDASLARLRTDYVDLYY